MVDMENGITSAAEGAGNGLNISLTSASTKHRTQILKSLQQDLEDVGSLYPGRIQIYRLLTYHQILTLEHSMTD